VARSNKNLLSTPLVVTSAAGANGNGYGTLLAFDPAGAPAGAFSADDRIADPHGLAVDRERGLLYLNVNHAGTRLYATNTGDNSIEVYDLTDPFNPVDIQHFVMEGTTGAPFSTVIDESDQWLFVSSEQSTATATATTEANAFHTLKVREDGMLTEPFPPTVLPIGGSVPVQVQGITVVGAH
jgi:hypothetical protein